MNVSYKKAEEKGLVNEVFETWKQQTYFEDDTMCDYVYEGWKDGKLDLIIDDIARIYV